MKRPAPPPPPPQPDFSILGNRPTGRYRLRPILFGFSCRLEELIENRDGNKQWKRVWYDHELDLKK
jgi:hypothetical protein